MQLPKTKEQKQFEDMIQLLFNILAGLDPEDRNSVINHAIALYNQNNIKK